jgi:hypothetical protein
MASGWGNNTFGYLKWGQFGNETVNVTNPNDTLWGTDTYGSYFYGGGGNLNATLQDVVVTTEINIGWGSDTWGTETWGQSGLLVDVTGIGLTATLDSITTKSDVDDFTVTGEELTITEGNALGGTQVIVTPTGEPMTATLQYQEAIVDPTGQELTANDGTADLDANTIAEVSATSAAAWNGNYAWGFGVYGNQQVTTLAMSMQEGDVDPAPDVALTGQAMAMVQGEETVTGDANVDVTGEAMAANQGQAELDANTIAAVTGQEMTMQENDVIIKGSANVFPTGIGLTMALGTNRTLIWNQVNTGTAPTWTEVDTAA